MWRQPNEVCQQATAEACLPYISLQTTAKLAKDLVYLASARSKALGNVSVSDRRYSGRIFAIVTVTQGQGPLSPFQCHNHAPDLLKIINTPGKRELHYETDLVSRLGRFTSNVPTSDFVLMEGFFYCHFRQLLSRLWGGSGWHCHAGVKVLVYHLSGSWAGDRNG